MLGLPVGWGYLCLELQGQPMLPGYAEKGPCPCAEAQLGMHGGHAPAVCCHVPRERHQEQLHLQQRACNKLLRRACSTSAQDVSTAASLWTR